MEHNFAPHGDYKPYVQGQVLVANVYGAWNIEMHQESGRLAAPLVKDLDARGHWGSIVIVHETLVTSLEVFRAGRDAVARLGKDSRLVSVAWVIRPDVEGYLLLLPRVESLYHGLLESKVFGELADAMAWTQGILAGCGQASPG